MLSIPTTPSTYTLHKPHYTSSIFKTNHSLLPFRNQLKSRFQQYPSLQKVTSITCGVTLIDQTQFSETVLKSDVPVLVEFVAEWCGPCRLIAPAIEWASQEYKDKLKVVKIDHDSNPQLIEEYRVYGLPALILFHKGKEIGESRREGAMTKVKLKEYLDGVLESIAVA
ncbi:hypothetical protein IFM89_026228 [Coptis chinensis]|uniref:Thioredoxin domain-containing protein n=1 Tax=Coptis chinensis TaxID=261450 RepID=A0A835IG18_9MAGN|nr:hypothetical protein IFM89_026228 [Coptis chinensis]